MYRLSIEVGGVSFTSEPIASGSATVDHAQRIVRETTLRCVDIVEAADPRTTVGRVCVVPGPEGDELRGIPFRGDFLNSYLIPWADFADLSDAEAIARVDRNDRAWIRSIHAALPGQQLATTVHNALLHGLVRAHVPTP